MCLTFKTKLLFYSAKHQLQTVRNHCNNYLPLVFAKLLCIAHRICRITFGQAPNLHNTRIPKNNKRSDFTDPFHGAGAAPLYFNDRAFEKLVNRKSKVRTYYLDMNLVGAYCKPFLPRLSSQS